MAGPLCLIKLDFEFAGSDNLTDIANQAPIDSKTPAVRRNPLKHFDAREYDAQRFPD